MGIAGFSAIFVLKQEIEKRKEQARIALRKERLQMPPYELKGDELVNFPWNHDNIDEWLYRPVKVTGRFIYKHKMIFDRRNYGQAGGHLMLPMITKENEELEYDSRQGIIVNKGWTPIDPLTTHFDKYMGVSDVHLPREITAYVSVGEQHTGGILGKKPNVVDEQRWSIGNFYLPDMVRATHIQNVDAAKVAILEVVDLDTPLDEKHPQHYVLEMTSTPEWPYPKTRAGALQGKLMPWDYERRQFQASFVGGFATRIGRA